MSDSWLFYSEGIKKVRQYAIKKIAEAQGPNDQEENATWCDFVDCLAEASREALGVKIELPTQEEVESAK